MSNFIGLVYATLQKEGIDTTGMSTDEAVKKYNELQGKSGNSAKEQKQTSKELTPNESKRLKELGVDDTKEEQELKQKEITRLISVLKQVKKVKLKEIYDYIKNLDPVKLKINDNEIIAEFDSFTAEKNVYSRGKSNIEGHRYKLENYKELPEYVSNSKYNYSKNETGKTAPQHKGVKEWHYFNNRIQTDDGDYNIVVNVRDKGDKKYVYEIAIKKRKS